MSRLTLMVLAAATILLGAGAVSHSAGVAAQQLPVLYFGTVRDADGEAVGRARVAGYVDGKLCGEARSIEDGSYGLPVPDRLDRAAVCFTRGATVAFTVSGSPAGSAKLGVPGRPVNRDLVAGPNGAGPESARVAGGSLTLGFNGSPMSGVNSVAVLGEAATVAEIRDAAEAETGRSVLAIWFSDGVEWRVFIPNVLELSFPVRLPAALYIVLE